MGVAGRVANHLNDAYSYNCLTCICSIREIIVGWGAISYEREIIKCSI